MYTNHLAPSVNLFESKYEKINFIFVGLFLLLSFIEILINKNPLDQFLTYQQQTYFFFVLFLSVTHVALTPVMIFYLPEINLLNKTQKQKAQKGIQFKTLFFFGSLFLVVSIFEFINDPIISKFLLAALVVGNIWHFILQYVGFFLFYLAKASPIAERTRIYFKSSIYCLIFFALIYQLGVQVFGIHENKYFGVIRNIVFMIEIVLIFIVYLLIYQAAKSNRPLMIKKMWYSLRLFLFPISLFSLIAGLSLAAIHAIEYVLLSQHYIKRSQLSENKKRSFYAWALTAICLNTLAYTIVWRQQGQGQWHFILSSAFFVSLTFTHFYADGLLFRMKDIDVRQVHKKLMG